MERKERVKLDVACRPGLSLVGRVGVAVPCEALLVELDDDLWTLDVGLLGWNEVSLVGVFPLHQEHQLPRRVRGSDDSLRQESAVEAFLAVRLFLCRWLGFACVDGLTLFGFACGDWENKTKWMRKKMSTKPAARLPSRFFWLSSKAEISSGQSRFSSGSHVLSASV